MRIGDRTKALAQHTVRIPRPGANNNNDIVLNIQALPLGYQETLEEYIPTPGMAKYCKQLGPARDEKGQVIKEGGQILYRYDTDDPRYKKAIIRANTLQTVAMFYRAVQDVNADMVFEAQPNGDMPRFYSDLHDELREFGLTIGDINVVVRAALRLSNIGEEVVEQTKQDFLQGMGDSDQK